MITTVRPSDPRVKTTPFAGTVTRYQYLTKEPGLSVKQITDYLNMKIPPIAKAAKLLYPELSQLSATAKLQQKIRGTNGRKLNPEEHHRLSEILMVFLKSIGVDLSK